jgi:hypothetical protein
MCAHMNIWMIESIQSLAMKKFVRQADEIHEQMVQ